MPEVIIKYQQSFLRNINVFLLGLLWTCAGGLGPAAMELWTDLTDYKDYGIDWKHVGYMALSGMGPLAFAYWRKHKALLDLPPEVQSALDAAEAEPGKSQNDHLYGAAGVPPPNPTQKEE